MFEEMGQRDIAVLDAVAKTSRDYFDQALRARTYVAWLAEQSRDRRVVAGGGVVVAPWPGFPGEQRPERAWILNLYTEPEVRRQGIAKRLLAVIIAWCRSQGTTPFPCMRVRQAGPCMRRWGSSRPTR